MIKLCWHKWSIWSDPIQTYRGNLQQWRCCTKCNKSDFRNLRWHHQSTLPDVIGALSQSKEKTND